MNVTQNTTIEKEKEKEIKTASLLKRMREMNEKRKRDKLEKYKRLTLLFGISYSLISSLFLTTYMFYRRSAFDSNSPLFLLPFVFIGLISISLVFF